MNAIPPAEPIDEIDRRIIRATQAGLPLCPEPYAAVAARIGLPAPLVMQRLQRLLATGCIRRIGVVVNHYRLGYVANGMTVWDVADAAIAELGEQVGGLDFVSHCYERPRHPPLWPYNLFAMVHGRSHDAVEEQCAIIARLLRPHLRGHDILYSTRILKKTGLRLAD
jgi:DNA-binding Lrp family transcriptional regulator